MCVKYVYDVYLLVMCIYMYKYAFYRIVIHQQQILNIVQSYSSE